MKIILSKQNKHNKIIFLIFCKETNIFSLNNIFTNATEIFLFPVSTYIVLVEVKKALGSIEQG